METLLDGIQISGAVGPAVGIPTYLLAEVIAKLLAAKEAATYPCA